MEELRDIGQQQLAISAITLGELYFGALNKAELRIIKQHLSLLYVIPINTAISQHFVSLMESYALGHKLAIPDAFIAATALTHTIELYTLNTKNFRFIDSLKLYQPKHPRKASNNDND